MDSIESVKRQIDEIFSERQSFRTHDGKYAFYRGTTACLVWAEQDEFECTVQFEATVLMEVPITGRLLHWVAISGGEPGFHSTALQDFDNGYGHVMLRYALRGSDVRKDDVLCVAEYLAEFANQIDEGAQEAFGGNLLSHYAE